MQVLSFRCVTRLYVLFFNRHLSCSLLLSFSFIQFLMQKFFTLVSLLVLSIPVFSQEHNVDSLYITTSDSVKLFVKRSGSGYPVLFIHGGPGSNSYYFEKEGGDVFSKDVQLIYLDQ